ADYARNGPIPDGVNLGVLYCNMILEDCIPKVVQLFLVELAFFGFEIEIVVA
ncbi:hypothetical protein HETIRDRAFT_331859, partial [Heterobasidion irregulare TC 32-1]